MHPFPYNDEKESTKERFRASADLQEGVSGRATMEDCYVDPTQRPEIIHRLNHGGRDFKGEK
jgi:hypothetical protein